MAVWPEPLSFLSRYRGCRGRRERRAGRAGLYVGQGTKSSLGRYGAAKVSPQAFRLSPNKALQQNQPGATAASGLGKGKTNQSLSRAQSSETQQKPFIPRGGDLIGASPRRSRIPSAGGKKREGRGGEGKGGEERREQRREQFHASGAIREECGSGPGPALAT